MIARSHIDLHNIRAAVQRIGDLSDNVFRFGPVKLGLESLLEFVPFVGEAYGLIAGGLLVLQGVRARVPLSTLVSVAGLVLVRTAIGAGDLIPVVGLVGDVAAGLFRAHKMAADLIVKAMDQTIYVEGTPAAAADDPEIQALMARIKSGKEKRRVVFLG